MRGQKTSCAAKAVVKVRVLSGSGLVGAVPAGATGGYEGSGVGLAVLFLGLLVWFRFGSK